ncbi:cytochrome c-type biogenesis protein [Amycolatopsis tucumanensis]|uniref:Cytochrome c-type biogenesis protein n=1 Tax=Amycolatopsis tucumanensis TaxID=401106 RepID=A0ABP7JXK9_9PSEU|nr:cytochrome c-type biogenesis protein [Amycolatopsis tucumanensis]MCF6429161.1 cytochrome c-type biogenesis protein CcmH [Amycolatopsis tucumanensis]
MRRKLISLACLAGVLTLLGVVAVQLLTAPDTPGDRAYQLEQRLRCPVCKSVSIAESPSETATAMRQAVQEQVTAGRSDQEVVDYFRARYGDWVLLDPPAHGRTLLLWLLPAVGVLAGLAGVVVLALSRRHQPSPFLPEEQRQQVARAVADARGKYRREDLL